MIDRNLNIFLLFLIFSISLTMHFTHFPKELISIHAWRQTQTQSTIINFFEEDMNILNPRRNDRGDTDGIFRMEFPLMQWIVAVFYKVFGKHLIITRIIMFVIGLFSLAGMHKLLTSLFHNYRVSLIGTWALSLSPSFFYYMINPIPDNLAMCCSIWGIAFFFCYINQPDLKYLILSSAFLCMGALCKIPFIIYYMVPFVYFIIQYFNSINRRNFFLKALIFFSLILLPAGWYAWVVKSWHGNNIVHGIFNLPSFSLYTKFILFTVKSTLPELLLNYSSVLLFVAGFYFFIKKKAFQNPKSVLLMSLSLTVLVYYLFEAYEIGKVHDYYLFPFLPLLFIIVAYGAENLLNQKSTLIKKLTVVLLLLLPITCSIRTYTRWDSNLPGFNSDLLIYKKELQNAVPKNSLVVAGNDESHFVFLYYIDKKGWGFHNNHLSKDQLEAMINKGAKYLYTDSKYSINENGISQYIENIVAEFGSIKIYKLKSNFSD